MARRGTGLPAYRIYRLDENRRIIKADWIAADSDAEALDHARQRSAGAPFELWERNRLVGSSAEKGR
jgi:hypothetical protein